MSAACIATAVYLERRRGIRASAFLGLHLAAGLINDVTRTKLFFDRDWQSVSQLAAIATSLRFALFVLQWLVKPTLTLKTERGRRNEMQLNDTEPEVIFAPVGRFLWACFGTVGRSGNVETQPLPASLLSASSQRGESGERSSGIALLTDCLMKWKLSLVAIAFPRLCVTALLFTQPWLSHSMIQSHRQSSDERLNWPLIRAVFLSYNGASIFKAIATLMKYQLLMKIRGTLFCQVFAKMQRIRASEAKKHVAITLVSSDMDGISNVFPTFLEFPFSIVDTCLGIYLLAGLVRQATLIIFIPLTLATVLGFVYGNYITPALRNWNQNIESRVTKTAHMLAQFPAIKMLGLAPKAAEFLQHIRVKEIQSSWKYRVFQAMSISTVGFLDMITPVMVIAGTLFWQIFGPKMTAELVFPTLGLVALVQGPITSLLQSGPATIALIGSFKRIQEYLRLPEADDPRVLLRRQPREITRYWPTETDDPILSTRSVQQDPSRVIYFDNVSIAPFNMETPLMSNVTVSIAPGSVNVLFGPTGSGKTTFLNGILGEAEVSDGVLYVNDMSIAVCGESLWLQDMTIREFIIGASSYDAAWFHTVVTACRLLQDINQFKDGELHTIGSDGKKLSGGQRQRLCIARSVFARASTVILDDAFSAIDGPTAVGILYALCGRENGLLRRMNCTVLMTGYLTEFMDVADTALLFDANCKITQKSGNQLNDRGLRAVLHLMYKKGLQADPNSDDSESESETEGPPRPPLPTVSAQQMRGTIKRSASRSTVNFNLYMFWIDRIGRRELLQWLALVLIMCTAEGCPTIYMQWWIKTWAAEKIYLIGYAFLAATAGLLGGPCVFLIMIHLSPKASIGIHDVLNDVVVRSTLGFISAHASGSLLNRYSVDMDLVAKHVSAGVYNILYMGITTLFHVGIVLSGARYMLALLPLLALFIFAIQRKYIEVSRYMCDLEIKSKERLITLFRETAAGLVYVRAFGWQTFTQHRQFDLLYQSQKPYYLSLCTQLLLTLALDLLSSNVAVALSAITLCIPGSATESSSGLSFLILIILGRSLNRALIAWTSLETTLGSLEPLQNFLETTPVESDEGTTPLPDNWPSEGRVEMTDVSAGYVCDLDEDEHAAVIQNISLSVEPGQKVGIMGRTGGGKSSLLMCLLGLLAYEGTVVIDGVDIRHAPLDQLRSRIITITQDAVEFEGTIRDNLLPFENHWRQESPAADEPTAAEKRRREFILRETLVHLRLWPALEDKQGLETRLADAGLSHGEVQLLCIARAAVHHRVYGGKLVLVDEATGGVDAWRDQVVREVIRDYFRGCTILIVAHRAEHIADSNISFKMVEGRMQSYRHWF